MTPVVEPTMTFDDVFRKYYSTMVRFAMKLLKDQDASNTIVIDVFMKLHRTGDQFLADKSKAFLYISIRNACVNLLVHDNRVRKKEAGYIKLQTAVCHSAFHEIVRSEIIRELMEVVESLPPQCKKILKLRYFEEKKYHEIAHLLNLSSHTVKNQIRRGEALTKKRMVTLSASDGFL